MDRWEVSQQQVLFDDAWARMVIDTLERDDETKTYRYLISPVDSVATVAVSNDGNIVLTRQYRHPLGRVIFDLPAGRTEPGEPPIDGARRELEEETGYRPEKIIPIGHYNPFPGSLQVTAHLFFATDLKPGKQDLDPGEELEVHLRPFEEVYAEVLNGKHIDGSLQMGMLLARVRGLI